MLLENKKAIITGGAGGLGYTTTKKFASEGATVYVFEQKNKKAAEQLVEEVSKDKSCKGKAVYVPCDLDDTGETGKLAAELVKKEGGIDILINNAAIYPSKEFLEYSMDEYRNVHRVNVESGITLAQTVVPGMIEKDWGRIINIASITFYGGWEKLMPYVVSKGSLVGLTRALARELGKHNITVNSISPGAFPTDAEKIHPDPEGYQRFVLEHQALKRRGKPEDIANTLLFLSSDMSSFITGQVLNVDGGWVMH